MDETVQSVKEVIANYASTLQRFEGALEGEALARSIAKAVDLLAESKGRLIVAGMGKSGLIGRKLAATFSSTGTPAFFVHPAEASHGDLGMIQKGDVALVLSWSGETKELSDVLVYAKRFAVPVIALTGALDGTLAKAADVALVLPRVEEACPHNLAPTTSTLLQLAVGDALAVTLLKRKGLTQEGFRQFHPGGKLGAALTPLRDVMHEGKELPLIAKDAAVIEVVAQISAKAFGIVGVLKSDGTLAGVVTDGDLRRFFEANADGRMSEIMHQRTAEDLMTKGSIALGPDGMCAWALNVLQANKIAAAFVLERGKPVGLITVLQLLSKGVA